MSSLMPDVSHGSIPRFFEKGYKETAFSKKMEISAVFGTPGPGKPHFTTMVDH